MAKYDLNTPAKTLFADDQAVAAIRSVAPALAENPMVKGLPMGLRQVAAFSGGKISEEMLIQVEAALADIN